MGSSCPEGARREPGECPQDALRDTGVCDRDEPPHGSLPSSLCGTRLLAASSLPSQRVGVTHNLGSRGVTDGPLRASERRGLQGVHSPGQPGHGVSTEKCLCVEGGCLQRVSQKVPPGSSVRKRGAGQWGTRPSTHAPKIRIWVRAPILQLQGG